MRIILYLFVLILAVRSVDISKPTPGVGCGKAAMMVTVQLGIDSIGDEAGDLAAECSDAVMRMNSCGAYYVITPAAAMVQPYAYGAIGGQIRQPPPICQCIHHCSKCDFTQSGGQTLYRILLFDESEIPPATQYGGNGIPMLHPIADMENAAWFGYPCPGQPNVNANGMIPNGAQMAGMGVGGSESAIPGGIIRPTTGTGTMVTPGGAVINTNTGTTTNTGGTAGTGDGNTPGMVPCTCELELQKARTEMTDNHKQDLWASNFIAFGAGILFTILSMKIASCACDYKQGTKDQDLYRIVLDEQQQ
eukprot:UN27866